MQRSVVISRNGMGAGDPELSIKLLERFLASSLEHDDVADVYVFFNDGVLAATAQLITPLLMSLIDRGADVFLCGTCLDFHGLSDSAQVGKVCCMNDIRIVLGTSTTAYL